MIKFIMKWPKIFNINYTTKSDRLQGGSQDFHEMLTQQQRTPRGHHGPRHWLFIVLGGGSQRVAQALKLAFSSATPCSAPGTCRRRILFGGSGVGDYGAEAGGEETAGRKEGQKADGRAVMRGAVPSLAELGGIHFHIRGKMLTADLLSAVPDLTNGGRWGILYNNEILRCCVKDLREIYRLYR